MGCIHCSQVHAALVSAQATHHVGSMLQKQVGAAAEGETFCCGTLLCCCNPVRAVPLNKPLFTLAADPKKDKRIFCHSLQAPPRWVTS